jgi:beta-galactosidase
MLNGQRFYLAGGEFHYWRLPSPDLWGPVLQKMKASGINSISIYFHWSFHSPRQGEYYFDGIRDVERVLRECEKAGLYVIARPGPYINAETDAGGLPAWLLPTGATLRSNDPAYMTAVKEWFDEIVPIIARHQLHRGGSVILFQIENELGDGDPQYMSELYRLARSLGIEVPIFHNDSIAWAQYPYSVDFSAHDDYPAWFFCREPWTMQFLADITDEHEYVYRDSLQQLHFPLMEAEYQSGSIDYWGGPGYQCCYDKLGPAFTEAAYKSLMGEGTTAINQYMFYGGTSWGYLGYPGVYSSYDYGAPLREWTNLGSRYDASKRVFFFATGTRNYFTKTDRVEQGVIADHPDLLHRIRKNPDSRTLFLFLRNMYDDQPDSTTLSITCENQDYRVPSEGKLYFEPRATRILVANYPLISGKLVFTSHEILTIENQADQQTIVLYGREKTPGEALLELEDGWTLMKSHSDVRSRLNGNTLRLQWTARDELKTVVLENREKKCVLVLTHTRSASRFWRIPSEHGNILVHGGYFLAEPDQESVLYFETTGTDTLTWFGGKLPGSVRLDNATTQPLIAENGLYRIAITDRSPSWHLPELSSWQFRAEPFEGKQQLDTKEWSNVHRFNNLSPDTHGFHHGFVWYRGMFRPQPQDTITGLRIHARHSYSVWLNETFLGSSDQDAPQSFKLPPGTIRKSQPNIIAILVESLGHNQGGEPSKSPVGLIDAYFEGPNEQLHPKRIHVTNKAFKLDSAWKPRDRELFYGGGGMVSNEIGSSCSVQFKGKSLKIFGATGPDHGQAEVLIDGHLAGEIDAFVPWIPGQKPLLFKIKGWDSGDHVATIRLTGQKHDQANGHKITIDAIEGSSLQPERLDIPIQWQLQGGKWSETVTDTLRGHFNTGGLYGERQHWYDPGFDASQWQTVDQDHHLGEQQWVGWYRTQFTLDIPSGLNAPIGLVMPEHGYGDSKALIFLNGFLLGRFWPAKGPQLKFYLPKGVLNHQGNNVLAIALWKRGVLPVGIQQPMLETFDVTERHWLQLDW